MATTTITSPTGALPLYVAEPECGGPWPGVVVIHDAMGMTGDLTHQADWLAQEGYLAVAPDLFHGRSALRCMVSIMRDVRAEKGRAFDDVEAARRFVAGRESCTARVGVIGFCMGGGLALVLAPGHGFDASSVNYGTAPDAAYEEAFLTRACPIVASYGGRDRMLRGAAGRLEAALGALGVPHDVKEYPGAGHGFLNDHDGAGDKAPVLFAVFAKLSPGQGYDPVAAADARSRIVAFFDAHLKP